MNILYTISLITSTGKIKSFSATKIHQVINFVEANKKMRVRLIDFILKNDEKIVYEGSTNSFDELDKLFTLGVMAMEKELESD